MDDACEEGPGALTPRAVGDETIVRCEQVGEGAREEAAEEEAVVASSDRGEWSRSGVEQPEVMRVPLLLRTRVVGESEPDAVLAVDMGEWTLKGYWRLLSAGRRVECLEEHEEEEEAELDETAEADADRSAATAANEARGVEGLFMWHWVTAGEVRWVGSRMRWLPV